MAEEYSTHEQPDLSGQMDISRALENQAAVEAVAAAVAAQERHPDTHTHAHSHSHSHSHSHPHTPSHGQDLPHAPDLPQPGQGPPPPPAYQRSRPASGANTSPLPFPFGPPHRQAPDSSLTNAQQLMVLREAYARNPNPSKRELEVLAERTGRPWNKIREYFRQRRNKLRGLSDLEGMEEPGRASSWLQVTYRPGPATASVSQLSLYNAYKTRFDPYATTAPLLGGQELIQLACSTFPGCEMARDEGDYVLRGLRDRDGVAAEAEWDRGIDAMAEPLRGATWLLSNFQHQADPGAPPSLSQTELYTAYAARFSSLLPESGVDLSAALGESIEHAELKDFESNMAADDIDAFLPSDTQGEGSGVGGSAVPENNDSGGGGVSGSGLGGSGAGGNTSGGVAGASGTGSFATGNEEEEGERETQEPEEERPPPRLLNPVELIALARMTFPKCEPAVDEEGRFVIRGIERREGVEKGRGVKPADMFPFALATAPAPSDPSHPFTTLLKRKLALLNPEPDEPAKRRALSTNSTMSGIGVNIAGVGVLDNEPELGDEDRELIDGLRRFRHSKLGREVRDVCVQQ